jgi:thioredoxin-related protein
MEIKQITCANYDAFISQKKITILVVTLRGCSHCADFKENVLPLVRKQFPDLEFGEAVLQESNVKLKKYIGNDELDRLQYPFTLILQDGKEKGRFESIKGQVPKCMQFAMVLNPLCHAKSSL